MKLRRTLLFHNLRKARVRMSWNKYNLYNLAFLERKIPNFIRRTFFQQKWTAKSMTRAYHGEHIKEQKWSRMFDRRLRSVVEMRPEYMASTDGAEQATGRGSGFDLVAREDLSPWEERNQSRKLKLKGGAKLNHALQPLVDSEEFGVGMGLTPHQAPMEVKDERTPYMNMAFAPIERRIDVAIFRAMFASSARQARNLVIHGKVKVNGQPMNHATYLLNPGDMFQVEPEAVMVATGKIKTQPKIPPRAEPKTRKAKRAAAADGDGETAGKAVAATPDADADSVEPAEDQRPATNTSTTKVQSRLRVLARHARVILQKEGHDMNVKQKRHLRLFVKQAKDLGSQLGRKDGAIAITRDVLLTIEEAFQNMVARQPTFAAVAEKSGAFSAKEAAKAVEAAEGPNKQEAPAPAREEWLDRFERRRLEDMLRAYEENPFDPSKPYHTPWQPRQFMSPFAFIPRYLEVNQNICAAVYLRHPVARQGMAEVPSPFPPMVQQLAFNWYLRRR